MDEKLTLLLIEDDPAACKEMLGEINNSGDCFELIGVTNNPNRALQHVWDSRPDAVILDLDLNDSADDSLEFLKKLKTTDISRPPFVLVLTHSTSTLSNKMVREYGADYIMSKNQQGYSAAGAIDFMKTMKSFITSRKPESTCIGDMQSDEMKERRIQRRISNELDKLGISAKSIGYRYLIDAIAIIMKQPVQHVCNVISKKYGKTGNSVERAMQNAINRAWAATSEEELKANYTARIKSSKGIPTITEFIFYYAKKLNNEF